MTISLPSEIVTSDKTPRVAVGFDRTSGVKQRSSTARDMLIVGQMVATGTAAAGLPYDMLRDTDGETLFGPGSITDFMVKAAFQAFPNLKLTAVGVTEAGTKATSTLTIATNALINCQLVVRIAGVSVAVEIAAADTPTVIAAALALAINANTSLPVTASAAAGVVTLTAKNGGTIGNTIQLRAVFSSTTALIGTTIAGATATTGAMGQVVSGAGAVSIATVLAGLTAKRFHEVALGLDDSASGIVAKTWINSQSDAEHGFGGFVHQALTGTLSACTTVALAINGARNLVHGLYGSESWAPDIAAAVAAVHASEEVATKPLGTLVLTGIIPPPLDKQWIRTETRNLLDNGVTPLVAQAGTAVAILRSVITGVKNAAGNFDYSTLDSTITRGFDDLRDNVILMFNTNYARSRWADSDTDGLLPPDVATPAKVQQDLIDVCRDAESRGICQQVEALKSQIVVEKVGTQCQFSIPANIVDGMHEKLGAIVLFRRNVTSI